MHVTLVHVHVKPESVDDFIAACKTNHEASVKENGNRRFDILQANDDANRFVLYEVYVNADEAAKHKQTAHYSAWREQVADMMAESRQGIGYKGLYPQT